MVQIVDNPRSYRRIAFSESLSDLLEHPLVQNQMISTGEQIYKCQTHKYVIYLSQSEFNRRFVCDLCPQRPSLLLVEDYDNENIKEEEPK